MYALISGNKALVVDPCVNENARDLLRKREIGEILVLPTHEHYDHISGINWLRDLFSCKVLANEKCASNMLNPLYNASAHFEALFIFASEEVKKKIGDQKIQPYSCGVDESFAKHKKFSWQNHSVRIHHTPGHSQGSCCIFFDEQFIFTGDSLIKGVPPVLKLPGGSKKEYLDETLPLFRNLPNSSVIFPGHGAPGLLREFSLF